VSVRNLVWFWWRRFRHRARHEELFALTGIAVGVALLFAVQVSNQSLRASVSALTEGGGDARWQLVAREARGFGEEVTEQVERIPGVRAVAPVLAFRANAVRAAKEVSVTVLAADERLAGLGSPLVRADGLRSLSDLAAVALPHDVARQLGAVAGARITLQVGGRAVPISVAAVLGSGRIGTLADSPIVVTSLRRAQEVAGIEGRASRLLVAAEPGSDDDVRAALEQIAGGTLDVRATDFEDRVFAQLAMPNDSSTSLFAGIGALVGFLFAFNAMLIMARERRALISDMRMCGFRARTIVQVIVFDALVLGALASFVGIALGEVMLRGVFEPEPGYLAIAFPVGTARVVGEGTVILAFAAGVCAAIAAAVVPLLATYRSRAPMDSVEDSGLERVQRRRATRAPALAAGAGALLATTLILVFAPQAALVGMGTLVVAMLLALPPVLAAAIALVGRFSRRITSVVPVIATGELVAMSTRSTAIAAIAAIAVFGSTALGGARSDLQRGLDPNARELSAAADLWVSARGDANLLGTFPFPAERAAERLRRVPEVASVSPYRGAFLDVGDRRVWVIAPPTGDGAAFPQSQLVEGNLRAANARMASGGWAVASEAVAEALGLSIGDRFRLAAPLPRTLRLAAITTNFGWSPGTLVLHPDDYRAAWGSDDASALQVTLAAGTPAARGAALVERALGPGAPFSVQTAAEREASFRATTRGGLSRLQHIATLLVAAAGLAIAAAAAAMVLPRRSRLADLKLTGISTRSLSRALLLEAALLVLVGSIVGALFGLYGQQLLDRALNTVTGFPVEYSLGIGAACLSVALVMVVALLITAVPGWWAARVPAARAFDS